MNRPRVETSSRSRFQINFTMIIVLLGICVMSLLAILSFVCEFFLQNPERDANFAIANLWIFLLSFILLDEKFDKLRLLWRKL
jgi:hypothetical protein